MNQTFSFARFTRLHRWLWATKRRTYLIGAAALTLLSGLMLLRILESDRIMTQGQEDNLLYFSLLSLLLTAGVGSDVFSALFRQESAITYLMIPASRTEKFWLGVAYCVGAISLFSPVFFGMEALVYRIVNGQLLPGQQPYVSSLIYYGPGTETGGKPFYLLMYGLLLALSVALLGSFFFRRGVFVRNVGVALLAIIGLFLLNIWITGLQFQGLQMHIQQPFASILVYDKTTHERLVQPAWLTYLTYGGLLLMLWITARVRFNEIER